MDEKNQTTELATKAIKGSVQIDKPKLSKRIVNFLFSDRIDNIGLYLGSQILRPALIELLYKLGNGALQMALFGGNSAPQGGNYVPGYGYQPARRDPPTPYNMMSNQGYAQPQPGLYQPRIGLNDISFDSKDDALRVLDRMSREIGRYGKVRVADFYTFAGITGQEGNWTLQGMGWYNLDTAKPMMRTDARWIIDFPPITPLH